MTAQSNIAVCRPLLPRAEALMPYLRRVDAERRYSNHGPLSEELGQRLALHFKLPESQLVLASNGTLAIVGALLATAGRAKPAKPLCICPAYSFVATAVAAANCGFTPFFADIDATRIAMRPSDVLALPELQQAGAVIAVGTYGQTPDAVAWNRFHRDTGIPVILDAAACFDTLGEISMDRLSIPIAVSFHATKTFSTGEGGAILCADPDMSMRVSRALNFGFFDSRDSIGPSINGKLSEYHAAVGLAGLDGWPGKRQGFIAAAQYYQSEAEASGLGRRIVTDMGHANPYALFMADTGPQARHVETILNAGVADTRRWYGSGLHRQPEFANCPHGPLPVTGDVARRLIGLPLSCDLGRAEIASIVKAVAAGVLSGR